MPRVLSIINYSLKFILFFLVLIVASLIIWPMSSRGESFSLSKFFHSVFKRSKSQSMEVLDHSVSVDEKTGAKLRESYGKIQLMFEPNVGQTAPQVKFVARGSGYSLYLTPAEAVLTFQDHVKKSHRKLPTLNSELLTSSNEVVRMRLVEGNRLCQMTGENELTSKANYFVGNNPEKLHA